MLKHKIGIISFLTTAQRRYLVLSDSEGRGKTMDLTKVKQFEVAERQTGKGKGVSGQRQGKLHMRLMIQPSAFELSPPLRRASLQLIISFSFSYLLVFIPLSRNLQPSPEESIVGLSITLSGTLRLVIYRNFMSRMPLTGWHWCLVPRPFVGFHYRHQTAQAVCRPLEYD